MEKMDLRQISRRLKYISRQRQMIHHTSKNGCRHKCKSCCKTQATRLRGTKNTSVLRIRESKGVWVLYLQAETFHAVTKSEFTAQNIQDRATGKLVLKSTAVQPRTRAAAHSLCSQEPSGHCTL